MLDSNKIFELIEGIAATASKNEKQALVKIGMQDEQFKRVCEYAYNPFKTFGIAKRPTLIGENCSHEFDAGTWEVLDDLIARRLTGTAAIETVRGEMTALSRASAELFWRIIKKDLRAGFSESTINKTVKGLIPEFPYMRCTLPKDAKLDEFDWKMGVLSQEKADGMFANVNHEASGLVLITSRQGSEFPLEQFETLVQEVRRTLADDTQSHGEILVRKAGVICAREIGNGILNSVLKGGSFEADESPVYLIWDQIPLSSVQPKGSYAMPYGLRFGGIAKQLKTAIGISHLAMIETRVYHSLADAYGHYRDMLAKGKEGTVIKDPRAIWEDRTSKKQVKLKLEVDVDLIVTAIVPGKEGGKAEGRAGSLTCVTSCGGLQVDVTVKNEDMRNRIDAANDDWIGRVIVVRSNSIMPATRGDLCSLFLPRMVETDYRTDKTVADSLQRVRDQFDSAIKAA